ncbi:MAG: TolC family protein, partial [Phycisphaerae bacterium]|nr:TolC family protein [Phycisphaerae bacterium]
MNGYWTRLWPTGPFGCLLAAGLLLAAGGCRSSAAWREQADRVAAGLIAEKQGEALGRTEPFTIETPADSLRRRLLDRQELATSGPASYGTDRLAKPEFWPEADQPRRSPSTGTPVPPWERGKPLKLSLVQALEIGARNSRRYQDRKEAVFSSALNLDEELDSFRNTYTGAIEGLLSSDRATDISGAETSSSARWERRLESGAALSA